MPYMKRATLTPKEADARRILDYVMRTFDVTDQELSDRLAAAGEQMSRQSVQQRRSGVTRLRIGDVDLFAKALGVNPLVFSLTPPEAVRYVTENHFEQVVLSMRWFADQPHEQLTLLAA